MQNKSLLDHDVEPDTPSPVVLTGAEGIDINQLEHGDVLKVRTKNTLYVLKMGSDRFATAESDGRIITEETEVVILGSFLKSKIHLDGILCGHHLRLAIPGDTFTTSPIRSIRIERTDGEVIELGSQ